MSRYKYTAPASNRPGSDQLNFVCLNCNLVPYAECRHGHKSVMQIGLHEGVPCVRLASGVRFEPDVSAIEGVVRGLRCKKQQLTSRATSKRKRRRRTSESTQAEYARRRTSASRNRVRRRSKAGKEKARRRARRSRGEGSRPAGHRDPCLHTWLGESMGGCVCV